MNEQLREQAYRSTVGSKKWVGKRKVNTAKKKQNGSGLLQVVSMLLFANILVFPCLYVLPVVGGGVSVQCYDVMISRPLLSSPSP